MAPQRRKAMLNIAVAAVKQDKAKALDMFNEGEGVKIGIFMCSAPARRMEF
jgi:hypothetical protein